jgi:hypothetical protein
LIISPVEGQENSTEFLKTFSQEDEQEMTAAHESAIEKEVDIIKFIDLYEELEVLERRVIVKIQHIQ